MVGRREMRWAALVVSTSVAIGCGPSVIVSGDTEDTAAGSTDGSGSGGPGSASRGDGRPGSATAVDSTAGIDEDGDGPQPVLDVFADDATTGDVCIEWATVGCGAAVAGGSLVHGSTPLGEIGPPGPAAAYFVAAPYCDFCVEAPRIARLYFVESPMLLEGLFPGEAPRPGLELQLEDFRGPEGQEIKAVAVMRSETEEAFGEAILTIDAMPTEAELGEPFDPSSPAIVVGNVIAIEGEGWAVHGQFGAAYCPQLNEIYICE